MTSSKIIKVKRRRLIARFLLLVMLFQIFQVPAFALTSGPTQPEVQSFEPAGTTDMVDLFSGDFTYNIPLFELPGPNGGYPFNLSYHAGIGMDQEASWVGLGWNLNPGAITRQMRGLPDEFKGDQILTKMSIDPNVTVGVGAGANVEIFGGDPSLALGLSVYNNSYKGMGYNIDASLGFGAATSAGVLGGGLDVSLDSKEGVGVSPSIGLSGKFGNAGVGANYNSQTGLSNISLSGSKNIKNIKIGVLQKNQIGVSANISLAHPGYTPQISMPMINKNIAATFRAGGAWWGMFGSPYVNGFYNEQSLVNDKKWIPSGGIGYMNYQFATDKSIMDFNRDKDGMVSKEFPNLAIPSLTYDIYSVTGQGISAMYRPLRNDIGFVYDPETKSTSVGGNLGADAGPALVHVGVNLGVKHARSTSGRWSGDNEIEDSFNFQEKKIDELYEPWYFKVHGEPSIEEANRFDAIGGYDPVNIKLTGGRENPTASKKLERNKIEQPAPDNATFNRERKPRTQAILPITNEELLSNGQEVENLFKIRYINAQGNESSFSRSLLPKHHIAGYTALTPEGLRYNYTLPAYNISQEEVVFSAKKLSGPVVKAEVKDGGSGDPFYEQPGSDKYLKRTQIPQYAHSYLLTSIVGPDYVDVTGDGVTSDDLGYWVKFTYQNITTSTDRYQWRDPFSHAHFIEGFKTDTRDDKGTFTYGTKELWYLSTAETKSHVAKFVTEDRNDARGVAQKLQMGDFVGKKQHKLKEIRLITRLAGNDFPIKVVKLEQDYSLCKMLPNNNGVDGKLTLKKVWFEYGNSSRGSLNPYEFTYNSRNPIYDPNSYDRWGSYKPNPLLATDQNYDPMHNLDFPYADQDPLKKDLIDEYASAWSLQKIKLPSGGIVNIDYEADDYAYVQHKPAMQMLEIVNPGAPNDNLYLDKNNLLVQFKLKKPIPDTIANVQERSDFIKNEARKYLDQERNQVYFKIKVNLKEPGEDLFEYISGYADINLGNIGLVDDGSGTFNYGYFALVAEDGYHPFSMRAWQHLRANQPDLASISERFDPVDSPGEKVKQMKSMASIFPHIRQMFKGYYKYCNDKGWGKEVIAGKSWVRLNSPDKFKYGGGLRVRQITMSDEWEHDNEGLYGQIYEYTKEEDGKTISSGVAAYEPLIGGDENPLRYGKKFVQTVPLRSNNNMFFEYPINESYFPGAQVGYSKVTVTSLAAASLAGKKIKHVNPNEPVFPVGENISYGTTGSTVHEFYTAKDFPVITDETEKQDKSFRPPSVGLYSVNKLTSTQGYSILTNDMHGKPKKISNFRQDPSGNIDLKEMSWVKYNYQHDTIFYDSEKVLRLNNLFADNEDETIGKINLNIQNTGLKKYFLGQETEFFMDMREFEDIAWDGGVNVNVDGLFTPLVPVVVVVPWPQIGKSLTRLRTVVTNKVIFQSGILISTEAYDGGSLVKTENIKWDKVTGTPVLTAVNNNFDDRIFSYSIPAYHNYQGMGAAYQNVGYTFSLIDVDNLPYNDEYYQFSVNGTENPLFPGDEIILYKDEGGISNPVGKVYFVGNENGDNLLHSKIPLEDNQYKAMIVRSGYRNQLSVHAGTITALADPSEPGTPVTYQKMIKVPNAN